MGITATLLAAGCVWISIVLEKTGRVYWVASKDFTGHSVPCHVRIIVYILYVLGKMGHAYLDVWKGSLERIAKTVCLTFFLK